MALMILEKNWKAALTSILEQLTEPQFNKLLFKLDTIPQGVKFGKAKEDMPHIIIQYYGTEESISVIDKEMKLIPRNDAAVQHLLRPFVEKLKKQHQKIKGTTSKVAADSGSVAKKPKPAAGTSSKVAADSGSVAKKPKPAAVSSSVMMSQVAADSGSVAKKPNPAADQVKSCQPVKMISDRALKHQPTVKQDSSLKPTGSIKTKVQSAAVQTGRITIIRIKTTNKTNTHLLVEYNNKLQTVFVTTRLLANAFGFKAEDNFIERFCYEIPLTAEATMQGNKITDIRKL